MPEITSTYTPVRNNSGLALQAPLAPKPTKKTTQRNGEIRCNRKLDFDTIADPRPNMANLQAAFENIQISRQYQ